MTQNADGTITFSSTNELTQLIQEQVNEALKGTTSAPATVPPAPVANQNAQQAATMTQYAFPATVHVEYDNSHYWKTLLVGTAVGVLVVGGAAIIGSAMK